MQKSRTKNSEESDNLFTYRICLHVAIVTRQRNDLFLFHNRKVEWKTRFWFVWTFLYEIRFDTFRKSIIN